MSDRVVVKVFGERNTGTRTVLTMLGRLRQVSLRLPGVERVSVDGALEAAIRAEMRGSWRRLYLHALRDEAAAARAAADPWKHAMPALTPELLRADVRSILTVRNPYSWFVSLARRPYHLKGPKSHDLLSFLHRPWMTERREAAPAVLSSPMLLWSLKLRAATAYRQAAEAAGLPVADLRFEDLVADNRRAMTATLHALGIDPTGLARLERNTKRGEPGAADLAEIYAREAWRSDLTAGVVAGINARVDWPLAAQFGYARLSPGDFPDALPAPRARRLAEEMARLSTPTERGAASDVA
ncbi:MAG: hypothetical protein AAF281_00925 [Pseudomonadota bacterium]